MRRIFILNLVLSLSISAHSQLVKRTHISIKDSTSEQVVVLHINNFLQDTLGYGVSFEMNHINTECIEVERVQVALTNFLWIFPRDPDTVSVLMKHQFEIDIDNSSGNAVQIKSFVCISTPEEIYRKKIINRGQKYASKLRRKLKVYLSQKMQE